MGIESVPKCGIVGGGRTRNGLGPYIVRDLEAAGASVVAVTGRDAARTEAVAAAMRETYSHRVSAHTQVADMIERAGVDALVIAAPIPVHLRALEAGLAAGVSVLCEKPLVAPQEHDEVADLIHAYAARELLLMENCPWPYVLHVLPELYPELRQQPVELLQMRLSPSGKGRFMLEDSVSHFISVLQKLLPVDATTRVEDIEMTGCEPATESVEIGMALESPFPRLRTTLYLERCEAQPRPAWVAVNDKRVARRIQRRDYSISFAAGARSLAVVDPMTALLRDFVHLLRTPDLDRTRAESFAIRERARFYRLIVAAWG